MTRGVSTRSLTHLDNVACNGVAKSKVAGYSHEDVDASGRANAGADDADNAARRVVLDFVDNGKHLHLISKNQEAIPASNDVRSGGMYMQTPQQAEY